MDIDWMALVKVALVSFAFGVGVVTVFSVGILGLSRAGTHSAGGESGAAIEVGTAQQTGGGSRAVSLGTAGVCFAGCAAAILYGLWLLIPQFH